MTLAIHHALRASERATRASEFILLVDFNLPLALRVGLTGIREKR